MAGKNPYIQDAGATPAKTPFTITYLSEAQSVEKGEGLVVQIDPSAMPSGGTGLPGSVLDIAMASGVDIDHACGGVCACSTCHVVIEKGFETCNEATEDEEDQLEVAPGLTPQSRLGCQAVPNGTQNLVVRVPNWNRNLVRE